MITYNNNNIVTPRIYAKFNLFQCQYENIRDLKTINQLLLTSNSIQTFMKVMLQSYKIHILLTNQSLD